MVYKKILLEGDAAVLSSIAPITVSFSAAVVGTATTAARQDHKHGAENVLIGQIAAVNGAAAVVGTATGFSRGDHKHPVGTLVSNMHFGGFQAQNVLMEKLGSNPTLSQARFYFSTVTRHPYIDDGL